MAQNISDTIITNVIDHVTAVSKGFVGSYVTPAGEDLFQILVREQNPDDLDTGVAVVEAVDDALTAGTSFATIWSTVMTWLTARATEAGSSGLSGLITDRRLRVPHTFNAYVYYPLYGINIAGVNLFVDQYWNGSAWATYNIGNFTYGGSYAADDTLPTVITAFYGRAKATVAGSSPGDDWTITVDVTYPDATTGTETVVLAGGSSGTYHDIGAQALIACGTVVDATISMEGTKKVYINTPTGFVAGQTVLIWTGQYHSLLAQDYTGSVTPAAEVYINPKDTGNFNIGDTVTLDHEAGTAADVDQVIENINYETGLITFTANADGTDFLTANNAFMCLTTPDTVGRGEVHTIDTITAGAAGYLTLDNDLVHSYVGTSCKAVRLLTSIDDVATSAGGAGGNTTAFEPYAERTITQGSII